MIWPILLLLLKKQSYKYKHICISGLAIFTLFSFSFDLFFYKKDLTFNYYFPMCRFWEMALGGILNFINLDLKNKYLNNVFGFIGFFVILFAGFYINEEDYYPGYLALLPTVATMLLIFANKESLINKYILSSKAFTFIGKISYPMYLWHWPLLVFARLTYKQL